VLKGPDEEVLGEVPKTSQGLYKIEHVDGVANAAVQALTLRQLHCRLGHPSTQVIRDLLKHKMVVGIRLEYTPNCTPFFCESCVYAKATRKTVLKVRKGEQAVVFGGEVLTDLWGKSPS
jgi:hypothetical protein